MDFDLISDIHVDKWDTNQQVHWDKLAKSDICVVAGDVADNIERTLSELNNLSQLYKHVIFIEGNHEHYHYWPDFNFTPNFFKKNITKKNIHYLEKDNFIIDNVAFVGICGWWDFKFGEPEFKEDICRRSFIKAKSDICDEIVSESNYHVYKLSEKVEKLQYDNNIKKIVVVTHTVPLPLFTSPYRYPPQPEFAGILGNINMCNVLNFDFLNKIKVWTFGHNHDHKKDTHKGVRFVSNPRGRPTDFNRLNYKPITITV